MKNTQKNFVDGIPNDKIIELSRALRIVKLRSKSRPEVVIDNPYNCEDIEVVEVLEKFVDSNDIPSEIIDDISWQFGVLTVDTWLWLLFPIMQRALAGDEDYTQEIIAKFDLRLHRDTDRDWLSLIIDKTTANEIWAILSVLRHLLLRQSGSGTTCLYSVAEFVLGREAVSGARNKGEAE